MDDYLKDIIYKTTKKKSVSWSKVNSGSGLQTHSKATLEDGTVFLCKILEFSKERLEEYKSIVDRNISCFQNPSYMLHVTGNRFVLLLPWIEGNVVGRNEISAAAKTIRKVHCIPGDGEICISKESIEKAFEIHRDLIGPAYFDVLKKYVIDNLDYLNGRKVSVIHGDLHVLNMLNTAEGIMFIDIDDCRYGDPYWDLIYASNLNKNKEDNALYYEFLMSYFNGDIPQEFWKIANVYSIYKAMNIMRFETEHTCNKKSIYKFDGFMLQHKMMTCDVPIWFEEVRTEV